MLATHSEVVTEVVSTVAARSDCFAKSCCLDGPPSVGSIAAEQRWAGNCECRSSRIGCKWNRAQKVWSRILMGIANSVPSSFFYIAMGAFGVVGWYN